VPDLIVGLRRDNGGTPWLKEPVLVLAIPLNKAQHAIRPGVDIIPEPPTCGDLKGDHCNTPTNPVITMAVNAMAKKNK